MIPTQIPTDRVGLGSKVIVEDQKIRDKETYYLVFGDALEFEEGQVTMASPIGRALLGKAVGEVAFLKLAGRRSATQGRRAQDDPRRVTGSGRRVKEKRGPESEPALCLLRSGGGATGATMRSCQ